MSVCATFARSWFQPDCCRPSPPNEMEGGVGIGLFRRSATHKSWWRLLLTSWVVHTHLIIHSLSSTRTQGEEVINVVGRQPGGSRCPALLTLATIAIMMDSFEVALSFQFHGSSNYVQLMPQFALCEEAN